MIAADLLAVDLEPQGFARVCELASARAARPVRTVSVLHDAGRPVVAFDRGARARDTCLLEAFEDPAGRAAQLLVQTGADRVVLYDRTQTDAIADAVVSAATPERMQLEAFWANAEAFWSSPAIATAPAPPPSPWKGLMVRLRALGDDWWALLGLYDGRECVATLLMRVRGGAVDTLTSLDHLGTNIPRPPRDRASELIDLAEQLGEVRLTLVCDVDVLRQALMHEDMLSALAALEHDPRTLVQRNLGVLKEVRN